MKKSTLEGFREFIIAVAFVFSPILMFVFGAFSGWILDLCVGNHVVNGLNLLFGDARFTTYDLPVLCGTLAVIGSFFKSTQTNNNNKN